MCNIKNQSIKCYKTKSQITHCPTTAKHEEVKLRYSSQIIFSFNITIINLISNLIQTTQHIYINLFNDQMYQ